MFAARRTLSLLRAPPAGGGCACAASRRYSAHAPAMVEYLATSGTTDAFYHVNLSDIVRQHQRWVDELPRVTPHYAVKCNPDMHVLRTLADLGCGFDCASVTEMDALLDLDVAPDRIVLYGQSVGSGPSCSLAGRAEKVQQLPPRRPRGKGAVIAPSPAARKRLSNCS